MLPIIGNLHMPTASNYAFSSVKRRLPRRQVLWPPAWGGCTCIPVVPILWNALGQDERIALWCKFCVLKEFSSHCSTHTHTLIYIYIYKHMIWYLSVFWKGHVKRWLWIESYWWFGHIWNDVFLFVALIGWVCRLVMRREKLSNSKADVFFHVFSLILQINKYRKKIAVTHRLARFCYANGLIGCGRSPSGLSWNKSGNLKRQLAGGKWMRKKVPVFHTEIKTKNMVLKKMILLNQKLYILDYIFIHRLIDIQTKLTMYTI